MRNTGKLYIYAPRKDNDDNNKYNINIITSKCYRNTAHTENSILKNIPLCVTFYILYCTCVICALCNVCGIRMKFKYITVSSVCRLYSFILASKTNSTSKKRATNTNTNTKKNQNQRKKLKIWCTNIAYTHALHVNIIENVISH